MLRRASPRWIAFYPEGNTSARRHAKFVPGAIAKGYVSTREPMLKDEYDEWLARVVCFAFSIAPSALTRQMNRATAATVQEAALGEGLAPLLRWVKQLIDRVIAEEFGWLDLEFAWIDAPALSPLEQARIHELHVRSGIKTIDEVRAELGLDPLRPRGGGPVRGEEGQAPDGDDETEAHEAGDDERRGDDASEPGAREANEPSTDATTKRALAYENARRTLAKYSPLQPRVPRGDPAGGRWTTEGGGSLVVPAHGILLPGRAPIAPPRTPGPSTPSTPSAPRGTPQYKEPIPGLSGKEGAKNIPSWARGQRPHVGESGRDFARRVLDEKYGPGKWGRDKLIEYNQLKKYGDRAFRDPKSIAPPESEIEALE